MRQITLSEALKMGNKEVIPAICGEITAVYDRKTGESEHGPWSFQDAKFTDGKSEIKLKIVGLPDFSEHVNKSVIVACKETKKGLFGVRKLVEEYNGKTYHKIEVRHGANIRFGNQKAAEERADLDAIAPGTTSPQPQDPPQDQPQSNVEAFRRQLMRAVNAYELCCDAAGYVRDKHDLSPEHFQAMVASLFIYADKKGLIQTMPDHCLKPDKPTEPTTEPTTAPPALDDSWDDVPNEEF